MYTVSSLFWGDEQHVSQAVYTGSVIPYCQCSLDFNICIISVCKIKQLWFSNTRNNLPCNSCPSDRVYAELTRLYRFTAMPIRMTIEKWTSTCLTACPSEYPSLHNRSQAGKKIPKISWDLHQVFDLDKVKSLPCAPHMHRICSLCLTSKLDYTSPSTMH